jgi:hypothetical protein
MDNFKLINLEDRKYIICLDDQNVSDAETVARNCNIIQTHVQLCSNAKDSIIILPFKINTDLL